MGCVEDWLVHMLEQVYELQQHQQLCDVVIQTACGSTIYTHSVIIAAGSPVLKQMITNHKSSQLKVSIHSEFTLEVMNPLIRFLYTGQVDSHLSNLQQILKLSKLLKVDKLSSLLLHQIAETKENMVIQTSNVKHDEAKIPKQHTKEYTSQNGGRKLEESDYGKDFDSNHLEDLEELLFLECESGQRDPESVKSEEKDRTSEQCDKLQAIMGSDQSEKREYVLNFSAEKKCEKMSNELEVDQNCLRGENVFSCTFCGMTFQSHQSLIIHSELCQNYEMGGDEEDDIAPVEHLPDLKLILSENATRTMGLVEENVHETMHLGIPSREMQKDKNTDEYSDSEADFVNKDDDVVKSSDLNMDEEEEHKESEDCINEVMSVRKAGNGFSFRSYHPANVNDTDMVNTECSHDHFDQLHPCNDHIHFGNGTDKILITDVVDEILPQEDSLRSKPISSHIKQRVVGKEEKSLTLENAESKTESQKLLDIGSLRNELSQIPAMAIKQENVEEKSYDSVEAIEALIENSPSDCQDIKQESSDEYDEEPGEIQLWSDEKKNRPGKIISGDKIIEMLKEKEAKTSSSCKFCCEICGAGLSSKYTLNKHLALHSERKKNHQCSVCFKTFFNKMYLQKHFKSLHMSNDKHPCEQCDKVYKFKSHLTTHIKFEHCDDPKSSVSHKCPVCESAFRYPVLLKQHMVVHMNDMQFLCELCDKGFVAKHLLDRHMLTHVDVQPWRCEKCDKRFKYKSSLMHHSQTTCSQKTTEDDSHPCELCNKVFSEKKNLKAHVKQVHLGIKEFKCDICDKSFSRNSTLKLHLIKQHKDGKNEKKGEEMQEPLITPTIKMVDGGKKQKIRKKKVEPAAPISEPVRMIVDKYVKIQPRLPAVNEVDIATSNDASWHIVAESPVIDTMEPKLMNVMHENVLDFAVDVKPETDVKSPLCDIAAIVPFGDVLRSSQPMVSDTPSFYTDSVCGGSGISVTKAIVTTMPSLQLNCNHDIRSIGYDTGVLADNAAEDMVSLQLAPSKSPDTDNQFSNSSNFNHVSIAHITHTQSIFVKSLSSSSVVITNAGPPTEDYNNPDSEDRNDLYFGEQAIENHSADLSLLNAADIGSDDSYVKNKLDYSIFNLSMLGKTPERL